MTAVTNEMINAAHGVTLKQGIVISWEILRDIYLAMDAMANQEKTSGSLTEPVAWMHRHIDGNVITHRPADLDRHPDRWIPLYKNPTPCETCQALARTVMMDQIGKDA